MRHAELHLKRNDRALAAVIRKIGPYSIVYRPPVFDTLVRSIVYQQISGKAAATVYGRLEALVQGPEVTAESILALSIEELRSAGLSGQKAGYIRNLAVHAASGELDFDTLSERTDEEVIAALTAVKGIGVWTAQMYLIFALRRPNILPLGDLGVRAGMKRIYGLEELPKPPQMLEIAKAWEPYCSVASWYLWRILDGPATL